MMNDEKYEKAKKRVGELKKFYGNLISAWPKTPLY